MAVRRFKKGQIVLWHPADWYEPELMVMVRDQVVEVGGTEPLFGISLFGSFHHPALMYEDEVYPYYFYSASAVYE